jgi:uncharacterized protein YjbI with pentapeptide repeats
MGNAEHVSKLKEGVEVWNRWRAENPDVIPDLSGVNTADWARPICANPFLSSIRTVNLGSANLNDADLTGAHLIDVELTRARLNGANLTGAYLYKTDPPGPDGVPFRSGASLSHACLKGANLTGAHLQYVDLNRANIQGANLTGAHLQGAHLQGANLKEADLSGANLLDARGIRFNDTKILHARLTPEPGTYWERLLLPWFIVSGATDSWSTLRREYTGPNFIITLIALVAFLLPYAFQALAWRNVNAAQTLMRGAMGSLATRHESLEALATLEPCFARACEQYYVWQLLLAAERGWAAIALTLAVILYNAVRFYLTSKVMAYREEEERSGFTPRWYVIPRGYRWKWPFTRLDVGFRPVTRLDMLWYMIQCALGGYQHLVWLHIFLRCLLLVVVISFLMNFGRILFLSIELPVP